SWRFRRYSRRVQLSLRNMRSKRKKKRDYKEYNVQGRPPAWMPQAQQWEAWACSYLPYWSGNSCLVTRLCQFLREPQYLGSAFRYCSGWFENEHDVADYLPCFLRVTSFFISSPLSFLRFRLRGSSCCFCDG